MRRAPAVALGFVVLSVLLSPLGRELFAGDETKYSQVVREMREGSFVVPTLEGTPFTHKPPLHFWMMATLTYVFGVYSIWPFVLPSLIAYFLLLTLMWRALGPMAAFVCGTCLLIWGAAQTARMDVSFAALLALAAFFIYRSRGALTIAAGVATGVAFLIKGPMAPVITLCLFAFEAIRLRRKPAPRDLLGLLPMLIIPLLWLVPAIVVGGEAFWREIFFKQTVGRAVNAWVHKAPPWFYIVRAPATLAPWFFVFVAALRVHRDEKARFAINAVLSVLVPYTLLSSKLDVYMITLLPAVAVLIGRFVEIAADDVWGKRAAYFTIALFGLIGVAGFFVRLKGEDAALLTLPSVRGLFVVLIAASLIGLFFARRSLLHAVLAVGLVPALALSYAMTVLMPLANEQASGRPLVRALVAQNVPPEQVGLYYCPHLWTRGMPPSLWNARHFDAAEINAAAPAVIVTRRKNAGEIDLNGYRKVGELRMIGKWFDVYRR